MKVANNTGDSPTVIRPIPDPTVLTTQQLNREIGKERDISDAKFAEINRALDSLEKEIRNVENRSHADVRNLKHLLYDHFKSYDERYASHKQLNEKADEENKRYIDMTASGITAQIVGLKAYHDEGARTIEHRFDLMERDITRRVMDTKATIEAAFVASKEASSEQSKSNAIAVSKSEAAFSDQIKQLNINLQTITNAVNDKIDDVKDRVNLVEQAYKSGEGHTKGVGDMWGWVVGFIGVFSTIVTLVIMVMERKPG